jgi:hypothetical protein
MDARFHFFDVRFDAILTYRSIDQRTRASSAKVGDLVAAGLNRANIQRGDAAAERVQDVDRQLLAQLG